MTGLRSRVVLITGAVSCIGRATALAFAKCGSKLALVAMKKESEDTLKKLERISHECNMLGAADIHTGQYDLSKRDGCRVALEEAVERFRGMYKM